jgi:uncharacterized membrane protein YjgN (DUF898 family)
MFGIHAIENGEDVTIEQRADPRSFLGLSLKNGLLNLVTLTLYRFWGKTEVRRRLWSSIHINDEPLEYTGRGVELFIGFLLALAAIGLPFLVLVFGAQFLGPAIAAPAVLLLYGLMIYLMGFGRFTAFRYLASRTVWRGLRFHMEGSANSYAWAFIGYLALSAVTFGWFWPAAQRRLSGRLWASLRFGDKAFVYDIARARKTAPIYWPYVLSGVLTLVAYAVFGALVYSVAPDRFSGEATTPTLADIAKIYVAFFLALPLFAIAVAPYQAASLRTVAAGVGIDQVRTTLKLGWPDMAWLYISNLVLAAVSLGLLMPFLQARTSKFLINRIRPTGEANLTDVRQAPQGPKTGEGLADAFGLAPI